jgi:hypothetical protein
MRWTLLAAVCVAVLAESLLLTPAGVLVERRRVQRYGYDPMIECRYWHPRADFVTLFGVDESERACPFIAERPSEGLRQVTGEPPPLRARS